MATKNNEDTTSSDPYALVIGNVLSFITDHIGKTDTAKEMLAMWQRDDDGGVAEFVRWTINDGDYPKEETKAVISYYASCDVAAILGKRTKYGDTLTIDHLIRKLKDNGFTDEARKLSDSVYPQQKTLAELQGGATIGANALATTILPNMSSANLSIFDQLLGFNGNTSITGMMPQTLNTSSLFSIKNIAIGAIVILLIKKLLK